MEIDGNMFGHSNGNRGQNGNNSNLGWDIWEFNATRLDWGATSSNPLYNNDTAAAITATTNTAGSSFTTRLDGSASNALLFPHHHHGDSLSLHHHWQQQQLFTGDGSHLHPDPHLMCLKLGKRHYFEDTTPLGDRHAAAAVSSSSISSSIGKKGKPYYGGGGGGGPSTSSSSSPSNLPATVPRCQVDGCHMVLLNAKDYHRRHKVCEMHSKAPKVVVRGLEQRFCQQCSRFHAVSEFDDSKRSCRRRLAGHNERRRKSSHDSATRNSSQVIAGRYPYLSSPTGRALSLLSSKSDSWVSPADLSSRSSAALRELIAEHRATILARQLISDCDWHAHGQHGMEDLGESQPGSSSHLIDSHHHHQMFPEPHGWDRFHDESGTHVTLDLMQASSSAFGLLSVRGRNKEDEEECSDYWNSLHGSDMV